MRAIIDFWRQSIGSLEEAQNMINGVSTFFIGYAFSALLIRIIIFLKAGGMQNIILLIFVSLYDGLILALAIAFRIQKEWFLLIPIVIFFTLDLLILLFGTRFIPFKITFIVIKGGLIIMGFKGIAAAYEYKERMHKKRLSNRERPNITE